MGRLSHFLPRCWESWVGRVWSAQEKIPWNTPPRPGIEPRPQGGQTVRYIHYLTDVLVSDSVFWRFFQKNGLSLSPYMPYEKFASQESMEKLVPRIVKENDSDLWCRNLHNCDRFCSFLLWWFLAGLLAWDGEYKTSTDYQNSSCSPKHHIIILSQIINPTWKEINLHLLKQSSADGCLNIGYKEGQSLLTLVYGSHTLKQHRFLRGQYKKVVIQILVDFSSR